jgi:hypothetical protein
MSVCSELRLSNRTVSTKTRESGECSRGQHLPVLYEPHLGVKGIRWQEKKLISPEDSRSSEMLYSLALKTPLLFMPPTVAKRPGRLTGATEGDPQGAAQNQAQAAAWGSAHILVSLLEPEVSACGCFEKPLAWSVQTVPSHPQRGEEGLRDLFELGFSSPSVMARN